MPRVFYQLSTAPVRNEPEGPYLTSVDSDSTTAVGLERQP